MKSDKQLEGKVVIITGASSGIGRAIAIECARHKANVVLAARREELLTDLSDQIEEMGAETLAVKADVSIEADCDNLINKTVERFGRIDILINNAGVSMRALFEDVELEVLRRVIDINFWGAVYCTHFALPWLLKSHGSLVGISSVAGFKGLPGRTGYSASKFAMQGFLESVRIENRKRGLHVLIVCPGFTRSQIREKAFTAKGTPQGVSPRNELNLMDPTDVAGKTVRAVVRKRRLLILTFEGKFIIALQRLLPNMLDGIVYRQMAREPDSPFK